MTSLTTPPAALSSPPLREVGPNLLLSGLAPRLAGAIGVAVVLAAGYLLVVG